MHNDERLATSFFEGPGGLSANRKLRLRTRGDVRMNPSRTTPNGRELNVKQLAGDESPRIRSAYQTPGIIER